MKHLLCLLALLVMSGSLFAQELKRIPSGNSVSTDAIRTYKGRPFAMPASPAKTSVYGSRWYGYVEDSQTVNGTTGLSSPFINYMFPDSTIGAQFSTLGDPFVHGMFTVLDPAAALFSNNAIANYADLTIARSGTAAGVYTYNVDSIEMPYFYVRGVGMSASIADTLVIELIPMSRYTGGTGVPASHGLTNAGGGSLNSWSSYFFTGATWATNFNEDTVYFTSVGYDNIRGTVPTSATVANYNNFKRTYKFPLSAADTNTTGRTVKFSTQSQGYSTKYNVPSGLVSGNSSSKMIGAFIRYKPGNTFTTSDVLNVDGTGTRSSFSPYYLEENGDDTYPLYDGNNFASQRPHAGNIKGYNQSYMVATDTRYKQNAWGGYGLMIPSVAYTNTYGFEYPLFYFKLSDPSVSSVVSGVTTTENILGNAYPNPARTEVNIPYSLTKTRNVEITIYNAVGQAVKTVVNQNASVGNHVATINTQDLPSGVYVYTLKSDNILQTKKLVIE